MPVKVEKPCHVIVSGDSNFESMSEAQLKQDLEKSDGLTKYNCLKNLIIQMQNGEKFPSLLMTVIRFVMPTQDNSLKKLLTIYWEMVGKRSSDGKLLHEMILVCDSYRRDLTHPNEYVRGLTLRFLCRLKEPEIIEPLMPPIRNCLDHRLPYVRRNAIAAIYTIHQNYPNLVEDAAELMINLLEVENDNSCRRHAFMALLQLDDQAALDFIDRNLDRIQDYSDTMQLVIVQFLGRFCLQNPDERKRFASVLYNLVSTGSMSVRYECAGALLNLNSLSAIHAAIECYIDIGTKDSDNNIKLVVLGQLMAIQNRFADQDVLQDFTVDILKIMDSPDIDVTESTIKLVMELITSRNIGEIVLASRRALTQSHTSVEEIVSQRRQQAIVKMLRECSLKFPDVSEKCAAMLLDLLPQLSELPAIGVLELVKMTLVNRGEECRQLLMSSLFECFSFLDIPSIVKQSVWLMAEFATETSQAIQAMDILLRSMGTLIDKGRCDTAVESVSECPRVHPTPLVGDDGTYVSQSMYTTGPSRQSDVANVEKIVGDFKSDFGIAVAVASACCKIVIRLKNIDNSDEALRYEQCAEDVCKVFLKLAEYGEECNKSMNRDEHDRIRLCLQLMQEYNPRVAGWFESGNRNALEALLAREYSKIKIHQDHEALSKLKCEDFDDPIYFELLGHGDDAANINTEADEASWVERAVRGGRSSISRPQRSDSASDEDFVAELRHIHQLSGFSDAIYSECVMSIDNFVIGLDILLVNRTNDTVQNVTVEIATSGDLKVVEKPSPVTMGPGDFSSTQARNSSDHYNKHTLIYR